MKKLGMILLTGLLSLSFGLVGCDNTTEAEDDHVLVGEWAMDNMVQSITYTYAEDYPNLQASAGDTVYNQAGQGTTTLPWAYFQNLGVNATVYLNNDMTFTLKGQLPQPSDTLGVDPSLTPPSFQDEGTWSAAEDLSTLVIDGENYDLGGALSYDDAEKPTDISLAYTETALDTLILRVDTDGDQQYDYFPTVELNGTTSTTLGFVKQ